MECIIHAAPAQRNGGDHLQVVRNVSETTDTERQKKILLFPTVQ